ncbi:hypothetical protein [Yinghuangia soli]|uniref:Uncharacterized protein n=1 Tax=Yinghuangia soli TaxID=2908204 RepID=A0AA41U4H3_9ACTN|nr:hypothetical protein [Yinghuangia soli]MCF2532905.1 hypothetical protein [Yinghuangia soli]
MSFEPPVHLLLAALAEREAGDAAKVFGRVAAALGAGRLAARMRDGVVLPDAFVQVAAEECGAADLAGLAGNPCLTAEQVRVLIAAGGSPVVRAVFSPPDDPQPGWQAEERKPLPRSAETDRLDAAAAELQKPECAPERALELLAADPVLAHSARVYVSRHWRSSPRQLTLLMHRIDEPWPAQHESLSELAYYALERGALAPEDIYGRIRPAIAAVKLLARLSRRHSACFRDAEQTDAHIRPLLEATVGADPHRWARLAERLPGAEVSLCALLDEVAADPAPDAAVVPAGKARPSLLFLLRRMPEDALEVLLPHLDHESASDLIPGDVPVRAGMLALAHRTRHPQLLRKIAAHQHLRDAEARRIMAYDDVELDRILAWNKAGTSAALRREIFAGAAPEGRPRRPMDPVLRELAIGNPHHLEPSTLMFSGDSALVCLGLAQHGTLRRIDLADIVLSVWEREGMAAAQGVVTSVPERFTGPVLAVMQRAFAEESPSVLAEARAKWHRPKKAVPPAEPGLYELAPAERIRASTADPGHDGWLRAVTPADLVAHGRPARQALEAVLTASPDGCAEEYRAELARQVLPQLGADAETWAVFVQLLPEFEGTLPELVGLAAAAAYRPGG